MVFDNESVVSILATPVLAEKTTIIGKGMPLDALW
jgi:hypothetical protein